MVNGAKPLQVGDVCKAEGCIVSAINANEGKIAKVKGLLRSKKVIEVISSFLYRGRGPGWT
jgi:fatty acid synthase subunit alpha